MVAVLCVREGRVWAMRRVGSALVTVSTCMLRAVARNRFSCLGDEDEGEAKPGKSAMLS